MGKMHHDVLCIYLSGYTFKYTVYPGINECVLHVLVMAESADISHDQVQLHISVYCITAILQW